MSKNVLAGARASFAAAAGGFVDLVGAVNSEDWERPALGCWSVRSLVGHGARALSTLVEYLGSGGPAISADGVVLDDPVDYFWTVMAGNGGVADRERVDQAIAARGVLAGTELGPDPAKSVADKAVVALRVVESAPDDRVVLTPAGPMTLAGYLPTRTFELAVHSLDLAEVCDLGVPGSLDLPIATSLELAGRLAGKKPEAASLLHILTGRIVPVEPVSVL